jgi:hypothetical protein
MGATWNLLAAALLAVYPLGLQGGEPQRTKTETFDADPGWEGVNNRTARRLEPVDVRQDFGYSRSKHAGGGIGEMGGVVTPTGEPAYYGKVFERVTLADALSASGRLSCPDGEFHLLLGFFNARTINEWRTPNTIAIRLNGRGDHFYAYVEYCTAKWRAGGDTTPFPSREDPTTGRLNLIGFPSGGTVHRWTLNYDPHGNDGQGIVTATIGDAKAVCELQAGHRRDGAVFNRFGILNVAKSADTGGEIYIDDVTVNGVTETFTGDPQWDGLNNHTRFQTRFVRPRFDFGYSQTRFAGGKSLGELGGRIFRGDCRYPERMACYGDAVGPLTLNQPFRASGKLAMTRAVSDSTTLFGFYHSRNSMRRNDAQSDAIPESVVGIQLEGPSSDGFYMYPVYRGRGENGRYARKQDCPRIYPDGKRHDWRLEYVPRPAGDHAYVAVTVDGRSVRLQLEPIASSDTMQLDRFGIITTWIDGNSQDVYWDDITYTVTQREAK